MSVLIVIDLHFIEHVGIKGKVIGPIRGFKKTIDVENHGDSIWMVIADERVPIGHVRAVIQCRDGSFAVAGCKNVGWHQHKHRCNKGQQSLQLLHKFSSCVSFDLTLPTVTGAVRPRRLRRALFKGCTSLAELWMFRAFRCAWSFESSPVSEFSEIVKRRT